MKTKLLLVLAALFSLSSVSRAQVTAFTYQGVLNSDGFPVTAPTDLTFALFTADTGGSQVGPALTNASVAVSNGLFVVTLDFGVDVFTGPARWLAIAVRPGGSEGDYTNLAPRQPITATPYAIFASGANAAGISGVLPSASIVGNYTNAVVFDNPANAFTGNGAGLTSLNASELIGGTVSDARLSASVSLLGPTIETVEITDGTIVDADISGSATIADGKLATIVTAGKVADSALSGNVALRGGGNTFNGDQIITNGNVGIGITNPATRLHVDGTVTATSFAGDGSGLTGLNAGNLVGGTVPDALLSTNVSLLGAIIDSVDVNTASFNTTFWRNGGNAGTTTDTHFLGTTDNQPLEFKVNNQRVLRLEPTAFGPNIIGGFSGNFVSNGVVGATIAGGGLSIGGQVNQALNNLTTVSGGADNVASGDTATVGGGLRNVASGSLAIIGGGLGNTASGDFATIPGGRNNAAAHNAFAAGTRAKANHTGAFVWADSTFADFASTADNQFLIRAGGGVGIGTNDTSGAALRVAGTIKADSFAGDGSGLAGLNADNITSGTLLDARLSASVSLLGTNIDSVEIADDTIVDADISGSAAIADSKLATITTTGKVADSALSGNVSLLGQTIDSVEIADGTIVDADISGSAAIADSKLATITTTGKVADSALSGNVSLLGQSIASIEITDGTIVDADISASAAIADTKLATISSVGKVANSALSGSVSLLGQTIEAAEITDGTIVAGDVNAASFDTTFWRSLGNGGTTSGTHFIGTTDSQPVEFKVNNLRAFRLEPNAVSPNVVGGYSSNFVSGGLAGAIIGGGGQQNQPNQVLASFGTIGGGLGNTVGGLGATVGGGASNNAAGSYATIPGGHSNIATDYGFAAGRRARADHQGAFVWADATDADFATTTTNQFLIRAGGGVGINTTAPQWPLDVNGSMRVGGANADGSEKLIRFGDESYVSIGEDLVDDRMQLTAQTFVFTNLLGSARIGIGRVTTGNNLEVEGEASKTTAGSWLANSDARIKQDIQPVMGALDKLSQVRLVSFRYTDEYRRDHLSVENRPYLNVVAQEFREVFPEHVKSSGEKLADGSEILQVDTYPLTIYSAAAVQELNRKVEERSRRLETENAKLQQKNAELETRLAALEKFMKKLNVAQGGAR